MLTQYFTKTTSNNERTIKYWRDLNFSYKQRLKAKSSWDMAPKSKLMLTQRFTILKLCQLRQPQILQNAIKPKQIKTSFKGQLQWRQKGQQMKRATNEEMRAWRKLDRPLYKKLNFKLWVTNKTLSCQNLQLWVINQILCRCFSYNINDSLICLWKNIAVMPPYWRTRFTIATTDTDKF